MNVNKAYVAAKEQEKEMNTTIKDTGNVVEIFSPPRVLGPGNKAKITGDLALILKTGCNCRKKEERMWAIAEAKRRKPKAK